MTEKTTAEISRLNVLLAEAKDGGDVTGDSIMEEFPQARHAGEMVSEITPAMVVGEGLGTIARTIHPYPAPATAIRQAGDAYNQAWLTPREEIV